MKSAPIADMKRISLRTPLKNRWLLGVFFGIIYEVGEARTPITPIIKPLEEIRGSPSHTGQVEGRDMAKKGIANKKKGLGEYIAYNPSRGKKVIVSGSNPATVIKQARKQGVDVPAIVFVPEKDITCLY